MNHGSMQLSLECSCISQAIHVVISHLQCISVHDSPNHRNIPMPLLSSAFSDTCKVQKRRALFLIPQVLFKEWTVMSMPTLLDFGTLKMFKFLFVSNLGPDSSLCLWGVLWPGSLSYKLKSYWALWNHNILPCLNQCANLLEPTRPLKKFRYSLCLGKAEPLYSGLSTRHSFLIRSHLPKSMKTTKHASNLWLCPRCPLGLSTYLSFSTDGFRGVSELNPTK